MYSKEIDVRTYPIIGPSFMVHKNLISITKKLINKSILHRNDIMSPNGKIFGYQEFKQFYNININFLDFYSLTHCIPKESKHMLSTKLPKENVKQTFLERILNVQKVSHFVYVNIRSRAEYNRGHEEKWAVILNKNLDTNMWSEIYLNNFRCCVDSSMRAFQYSILLRTVPTNKFLFRCKLVASDKCYFCNENTESIEHVFYLCPFVKNFWFKVISMIDLSEYANQKLEISEFLLGVTTGKHKDSINFLFTIVKRYISVDISGPEMNQYRIHKDNDKYRIHKEK